jgi:hypothetical protein
MLSAVFLIIVNTGSSTPVMAVFLMIFGVALFPFRGFLPALRWLVLILLVIAQLVMDTGAAHILARLNIFSGSTGWHRFHLIDQAINHLGEWFWIGTLSTEHWGWGLVDVTNQYILEAVQGGLLGMVLFVLFLVALFKVVGKAIRACDSDKERWIYWCAGIVLFVHCFSFLSVSYFGQMVASFFLFSGAIVGMSSTRANSQANQEKQTI